MMMIVFKEKLELTSSSGSSQVFSFCSTIIFVVNNLYKMMNHTMYILIYVLDKLFIIIYIILRRFINYLTKIGFIENNVFFMKISVSITMYPLVPCL